jgi:hypothetical protein
LYIKLYVYLINGFYLASHIWSGTEPGPRG